MADVGVVLLGPADVAERLVLGLDVAAVPAAHAGDLAGRDVVVGLASEPWPAFAGDHELARAALAPTPYFAVQSWHRHPAYLDRLVAQLEGSRAASVGDAHVLFTAPGPAAEPAPEEVVFLRETAEAVSAIAGVTRRSIAWTSGALGPSTAAALTALAEAHGRTAVLRCSLDPLARPDAAAAEASALGLSFAEASLDPTTDLPAILRAVVATVVEHEQLRGGAR